MIIISQFILHSTLAFHNKEPAIESSIVFLLELMHIRAYSKRSGSTTVSRRQSRVSSSPYRVEYQDLIPDSQHSRVSRIECHLTSGRYCNRLSSSVDSPGKWILEKWFVYGHGKYAVDP